MTEIAEWKYHFLNSRELKEATGHPLYTYRVTPKEFSELESILKHYLSNFSEKFTSEDIKKLNDGFFPALFVLYASEWWRRHYDGTGFAWHLVLEPIGITPCDWNHTLRSDCVEKGFEVWKLRLHTGGLRFLGSIAFQGGLPMKLLAQAKGDIGKVLNKVLRIASSRTTDAREIRFWIKSLSNHIPKSYRQDEIFFLLAEVILVVLKLREKAQLTDSASAIEKLDKQQPNWRDSFPLPVEDIEIKGIIEQLIRDVAIEKPQKLTKKIMVERSLKHNDTANDTWDIYSDISLPKYIDGFFLEKTFGIEVEDLTRTPNIRFIWNEQNQSVSLRKITGKEQFQITAQSLDQKGSSATSEHVMQLLTAQGQSKCIEVPMGHELDQELPWLFEDSCDENNSFIFSCQGSGVIASIRGILCIPTEWKIELDKELSPLKRKGHLLNSSRDIFSVSGIVKIETPDGLTYKIRCGQAAASNDQFELRGERLWNIFYSPNRAFRGIPVLYQITENGSEKTTYGKIAWQIPGNKQSQNPIDPSRLIGTVTAYWPSQGEIKWRSNLVILPEKAANIIVEPGDDISRGRLRFSNWNLVSIKCETQNIAVEVQNSDKHNDFLISVIYSGENQPPEWISLLGFWSGNTRPARFLVPFPSKGIRAIDSRNNYLKNQSCLAISEIYGTRMFGFLGDSHTAELKFELYHNNDGDLSDKISQIIRLKPEKNRVEVCLVDYVSDIRRILASTDILDACVNITLMLGSGESLTISVAYYNCKLILENAKVSIPQQQFSNLSGNLSIEEIKQFSALAIKINAPGEEPISLEPLESEGMPLGAWKLPNKSPNDQWLIYPSNDSSIVFRPVSLPQSNLDKSAKIALSSPQYTIKLKEALEIPSEQERSAALDIVIKRLATNFVDHDWRFIEQLVKPLEHLPLSTLDLWRQFTNSLTGMAALAIRLNLPINFIERFSNELPFEWEVIPLSAWKQAILSLVHQGNCWYKSDGQKIIQQHLETQIGILSSSSSLRALLEIAASTEFINDDIKRIRNNPDLNGTFISQLFDDDNSRVQQLMRNNSNREWPPNIFSDEILEAKNSGASDFFCQKNYDFRNSVINIPIYLALCASEAFPFAFDYNKKTISLIRKIKLFDPEWFSEAFDLTIARCLSAGKI